jgi:hypothetical protein
VNRAEELRRKYKYRKLIVTGRMDLPLRAAKKLVGPDCAYHLYGGFGKKGQEHREEENQAPETETE